MKIKLFIFYISFKILLSEFLDKIIVPSGIKWDSSITYGKPKNGIIDFYYFDNKNKVGTLFKSDEERDEVISKLIFLDDMEYYIKLPNEIDLFIYFNYSATIRNGKNFINIDTLPSRFSYFLSEFSYNQDSLLLIFEEHFADDRELIKNPIIYLLNYPSFSFDGPYLIEPTIENRRMKSIALKDCFIIFFYEEGSQTHTFKIFDFKKKFEKSKIFLFPNLIDTTKL